MSLASTAPGLLSRTRGFLRSSGYFDEVGTVDAYLTFEAALAEVEGGLGIIPEPAVPAILAACQRDQLDMPALREGAAAVGYPIVPLVTQLSDLAGAHGQWVHYGTTTQDVMDTAQMLQMRGAIGNLASLQGRGTEVRAALARQLDLHDPAISWHVSCDRKAALAAALATTLARLPRWPPISPSSWQPRSASCTNLPPKGAADPRPCRRSATP